MPNLLDYLYTLLTYDKETLAYREVPGVKEIGYDLLWLNDPRKCLPLYWYHLYYTF